MESLESGEPGPGGGQGEMEQRPGLPPVARQHCLHLPHQLRPVGGEEAGLGHQGSHHHLLHPARLLLCGENLAQQVESLPAVVQALGAED